MISFLIFEMDSYILTTSFWEFESDLLISPIPEPPSFEKNIQESHIYRCFVQVECVIL